MQEYKNIISFLKFGIVGVMNTLLNWIIFFFLNSIGIFYVISNVIAYTIATVNSFIWNSKWVFKYDGQQKVKSSIKFLLLNLMGLCVNTGVLFILVEFLKISKMFALIIATGIVMVINYIANKVWVFKDSKQDGYKNLYNN